MVKELEVREIKPREIEDSELERELIEIVPDAFGKDHGFEKVRNHIRRADYLYLGYISGEVIGWGAIKEIGDIAFILYLAVKRKHQGKGFLTKMIEKLLARNYKYVTVDTQNPVLYYTFYKNIFEKGRGEIYPHPQCERIPEDINEIASRVTKKFGYKNFEANTLIIRRVYKEGILYDEIPRCKSGAINKYFEDNLNLANGDTLFIVCKNALANPEGSKKK